MYKVKDNIMNFDEIKFNFITMDTCILNHIESMEIGQTTWYGIYPITKINKL